MKRHEPCVHLRPDYDRLENAHHIRRHPVTDEINWEPTSMMQELARLGLVDGSPAQSCTELSGLQIRRITTNASGEYRGGY